MTSTFPSLNAPLTAVYFCSSTSHIAEMAHYTQISQAEAEEILQLYGKSSIVRMSPLTLGISNSNYRIDFHDHGTETSVLLKISNDKDFQQLSQEQSILQYLNRCGYSYSLEPLPLRNGDLVYHHGRFFGVVYPFIRGTPPNPSIESCHQVGQALAKLHVLPHRNEELQQLRPHESVGFGAQEILEFTRSRVCPKDFQEASRSFFPDDFKNFFQSNFAKGLIHGDLYYDNTLFAEERLQAVVDFEQSGIGEYIFDLGISISGTCLDQNRISLPLVDAYLKGYESVRPLPEAEKKFLDQAILMGLLSISLWRIRRFNEKVISPHLQDSYRELLDRATLFFKLKNLEFHG
jgi:homoserine kinase type II